MRGTRYGLTIGSIAAALAIGTNASAESPEQRDARMAWWREARFGMFIHWGLYSVASGELKGKRINGLTSWALHTSKLPLDEYTPLQREFNPVRFDPDAWVRMAKTAGMKYIVITTKHHEGFCLFDSKFTDFDVMGTPFKRDILKELMDACRREGIELGWYYSILDWHHPDYLPRRPGDARPTEGADFERYVTYMKNQLRELVTNYGPVRMLWFDGEWDATWSRERGWDLYNYLRGLRPDILINNRVGKGRRGMAGMTESAEYAGDFGTPEQEIPAGGLPGVDWESCMTMNDVWGYKYYDHNWKSAETLLRMLIDCASKGGNFLLNVGPKPNGVIPEPSIDRLAVIGRWMQVHGESIHGTSAGPFTRQLPWGRCTSRKLPDGKTRLYLHVFDWPRDGKLAVPGLRNEAAGASLMTEPNSPPLSVTRQEDGITIAVPVTVPNEYASVVVVDIKGPPDVAAVAIRPDADGRITLPARDADIHGRSARYDARPEADSVGYWTDVKDWVSWPIRVDKPGKYRVEITYGCDKNEGGGEYVVEIAGQKLPAKVRETGGWFKRVTDTIGTVELKPGEIQTLAIRLTSKPKLAVMDLQKVVLSGMP